MNKINKVPVKKKKKLTQHLFLHVNHENLLNLKIESFWVEFKLTRPDPASEGKYQVIYC